jgi:hypothetical protein
MPIFGRATASISAGVTECSPPMKPRNAFGFCSRRRRAAVVIDASEVIYGRAVRLPWRDATTASTSSNTST